MPKTGSAPRRTSSTPHVTDAARRSGARLVAPTAGEGVPTSQNASAAAGGVEDLREPLRVGGDGVRHAAQVSSNAQVHLHTWNGVAELVEDIEKDARYIPDVFMGRSEVTVPIVFQGAVIGVLDAEARTAIHLAHRVGALAVLAVVGGLVLALLARPAMRAPGLLLGVLLGAQVGLGIANVTGGLPLLTAVAHNGNAALLVLVLLVVLHRLRTAYRSTFSDRG